MVISNRSNTQALERKADMAKGKKDYENNKSNSANRNDDFYFDIVEHLGVIYEKPNGWKRELNLVSYGGKAAKYDIREWDEEHTRMSKGITLHKEEVKNLLDLLNSKAEEGYFDD